MPADPTRFQPHRESFTTTLARTGGIAVVVATTLTAFRLHHLPASSAQWRQWGAAFACVAWISFGGHWVEMAYLNGVRPKIAHWSDVALVFVRLALWLAGGTILVLGALASVSLLTAGILPARSTVFWALCYGGPVFALVELVPHAFLYLAGRPSFWNLRG